MTMNLCLSRSSFCNLTARPNAYSSILPQLAKAGIPHCRCTNGPSPINFRFSRSRSIIDVEHQHPDVRYRLSATLFPTSRRRGRRATTPQNHSPSESSCNNPHCTSSNTSRRATGWKRIPLIAGFTFRHLPMRWLPCQASGSSAAPIAPPSQDLLRSPSALASFDRRRMSFISKPKPRTLVGHRNCGTLGERVRRGQ